MPMNIEQQTVLVTGAGRGLGAAIARAFAREGAKVAINYRNSQAQANELSTELDDRSGTFQADIRDAGAVRDMVARIGQTLGPVTTVIHNALADFTFNGNARDHLDRLGWAAISAHMETGLRGALNLIQATRSSMENAGFGRFVFIGTNLFQNPVVQYHDYTAAEAALLSLTRTAAAELGPLGITVNMVSGGLLRTTSASAATPEEAADVTLFFASPMVMSFM